MSIEQVINEKVERALGAALLRQIVLETRLEEAERGFHERSQETSPKTGGKSTVRG